MECFHGILSHIFIIYIFSIVLYICLYNYINPSIEDEEKQLDSDTLEEANTQLKDNDMASDYKITIYVDKVDIARKNE